MTYSCHKGSLKINYAEKEREREAIREEESEDKKRQKRQ